jgi:hypothetical protein
MADPFVAVALVKLFLDTVEEGPKGAAKSLAKMATGPVGTADDIADASIGRKKKEGILKSIGNTLKDCD